MSDPAQTPRPWLARLAERAGIEPSFHAIDGSLHLTSDETRVALLAAMGVPAADEASAREAALSWDAAERARTLEPVGVIGEGEPATVRLSVRGLPEASGYRLVITLEHGEQLEQSGAIAPTGTEDPLQVALEHALPLGYHKLACTLIAAHGRELCSEQLLIVAPATCAPPPSHATGIAAQLYSVRAHSASGADPGAGDFRTLRELVDFCADAGAELCALNPLCALDQAGGEISPYSPTTRLALHPLYLDVSELEPKAAVRPTAGPRIDVAQVLGYKLAIARAQLSPIALGPSREGSVGTLDQTGYARFAALCERFGERDARRFPADVRSRLEPGVERVFREESAEIGFQLALQCELERQLSAVAEHARARGVGLVLDLPIGSVAGGADTWSHPGLFARASLGAPPDDYSKTGQSWGLAPIIPHVSRARGHAFLIAALRYSMRHARALRVDHVIGMRRQFWVPEGLGAEHGAYVRCPEREWFAILALESRRSGCAVLGEDLGTVPEGFRAELSARGILRTHVMWFERTPDRGFLDPERYEPLAVVSATTHDLPPLRALWEGTDLAQRHALGLLDAAELAQAQAERERVRHALYAWLRSTGQLAEHAHWPEHPELERLVHGALGRAPSALLLLALDDLAGEREGVSIPGTGPELGNWRRRMSRSLAELRASPELFSWVQALCERRRQRRA